MNNSAVIWRWAVIVSTAIFCLLSASVLLWQPLGDPWAMVRYVVRLLIVLPLATLLAMGAVIFFDHCTPGNWLHGVTADEKTTTGSRLASALVSSALILGVFWVCIQG